MCVVSTEISTQGVSHTHNYIITDMSQQTLRSRLKDIISGSGNAAYSLEIVRDLKTCLSYVLKDGTYRYCPELAERIATAPQWVRPSASFEKSYALLKDDYINGDMSDYEFVIKLLGLYSDHKNHIFIAH